MDQHIINLRNVSEVCRQLCNQPTNQCTNQQTSQPSKSQPSRFTFVQCTASSWKMNKLTIQPTNKSSQHPANNTANQRTNIQPTKTSINYPAKKPTNKNISNHPVNQQTSRHQCPRLHPMEGCMLVGFERSGKFVE